jgi:hypothetical protein
MSCALPCENRGAASADYLGSGSLPDYPLSISCLSTPAIVRNAGERPERGRDRAATLEGAI